MNDFCPTCHTPLSEAQASRIAFRERALAEALVARLHRTGALTVPPEDLAVTIDIVLAETKP